LAKKHYHWGDGPAEIERHSIVKHDVLAEYLGKYFEIRTLNARGRERFRITLVDGFCGGGLYRLQGTDELISGSPLRMLQAVATAKASINQNRTKQLDLDVQYVLIDKDLHAIAFLTNLLQERGYGSQIGTSIHLIHDEFASATERTLALVKAHTPRSPTALFFLDQYGYAEVPASTIRKIFNTLPNSEVVLTFHVAAFATYTNDVLTSRIEDTLHIDIRACLGGQSIDDIKNNDADWRRFIQSALYQALVVGCGAQFFTPFFIRGSGSGHGEYWLVHLSQHLRAQDVMKEVHWLYQNHFVHYGGAGLNMLSPHSMGFMQEFDGGFRFDDVAKHSTNEALHEQLATFIKALGKTVAFQELFAATCNGSPATAQMYKDVLEMLIKTGDVLVISTENVRRYNAKYIVDSDMIMSNPQIRLI
jgi:three-Cys-motif partner protein